MKHRETSHRRRFLADCTAAAGAYWLGAVAGTARAAATSDEGLHLATNQYPWSTFFGREGKRFEEDLDEGLAAVARAGLDGFEPILDSVEQVEHLAGLLERHGLAMRSFYINLALHEEEAAAASIDHLLPIAARAREAGTQIVVVNPTPLQWGGMEDKDDTQLRTQAAALDRLGRQLAEMELTLSYHYHDAELRQAAREFHHMMVGTDPELVTLCLDAHWYYRGAGNSAVALFDVATLYLERISELHLRQSVDGVWTEAFGEGDIDHPRLAEMLAEAGLRPHLVLEQAVEGASPHTMDAVAAHRAGAAYARRVFAALGG